MSEELYEPLPDVDAYLERLGIDAPAKPTGDFLDELISAHQLSIPFDDLDVYEKHQVPSLGIADLYDKMIVRKRGGYCFELNGLFRALLNALGFDVRPTMGRVLLRPNPYPVVSHRANIVTIGGHDLLADVGFGGPMPSFAPVIADGATRTELGHTFTLHVHDRYWWDIGYTGSSEEEKIVLRICEMPVEEHDFIPLSFFQAQNPQSAFRLNRMVNIKTPDGARDLRNTTYTEFAGGQKTSVEIAEEELDQILAQKFGIVDWR